MKQTFNIKQFSEMAMLFDRSAITILYFKVRLRLIVAIFRVTDPLNSQATALIFLFFPKESPLNAESSSLCASQANKFCGSGDRCKIPPGSDKHMETLFFRLPAFQF